MTDNRVNGRLAVSRGVGDFGFKCTSNKPATEQQMSAEADIMTIERFPSSDQFLLLCCDGIFDVIENDTVVEFVYVHSKGIEAYFASFYLYLFPWPSF